MPRIETNDHASLYYRSWGIGKPVVFVSGYAWSGAMWEYQMISLSEQGVRCIAYDRRGHGRSDDPGDGYDFNTLADDLAQLLTQLDLREVTLVGQSMGCCEIARYLSRHGASRVDRVALISPAVSCILQSEENPSGVPKFVLDQHLSSLQQDRPLYLNGVAIKYSGLGSTWPWPSLLSPEMAQWGVQQTLETSLKALIETLRSHWGTDFRPDLHAFTMPTLVIHGDSDQNAPLESFGRPAAQAIVQSQLKVYEGAAHGLFLTHKDRLNDDLLTFVQNRGVSH
ncbi:alpha/beta fold hydrolase [Tengunoibacter tsumagoiensis]|uniref:Arylesterase n=1 Tax=Tengunoibacter tsumagoiensis TaxID=2014871 RepID=A0A402A912_9CHLR|nr:alpha/beta hydrolase [Tengunoibacter tsumagoiensis]GCE15431.1 arylesterase [Tengunoibacter tsumagoiensis]